MADVISDLDRKFKSRWTAYSVFVCIRLASVCSESSNVVEEHRDAENLVAKKRLSLTIFRHSRENFKS